MACRQAHYSFHFEDPNANLIPEYQNARNHYAQRRGFANYAALKVARGIPPYPIDNPRRVDSAPLSRPSSASGPAGSSAGLDSTDGQNDGNSHTSRRVSTPTIPPQG